MENVKAENLDLRLRLDQLEQYSRKTNLIIYGIPFKEEENVSELIKNLATALKVPYSNSDIVACHRLPNNKGNTPPLIVQFVNHTNQEEWIRASKQGRLSSGALNMQPITQIFCDKHLIENCLGLQKH